MTRRNRKKYKSKRSKVIQKNLVRNIAIVSILIVFLFVIYRFNFSSKSELTESVKINFKEFGENISLEEQEIDMEVLTDTDGTKYILLPEKINGYYVQQYHINKIQNESTSDDTYSSEDTKNTNTLLENIIVDNTVSVDEIAGLKKYYLTSKDYEIDESQNKVETEENNNLKQDEKYEEPKETTNTINDDIKNNNLNNTAKNEATSNTLKAENIVNETNTVSTENTTIENNIQNNTEKNEIESSSSNEIIDKNPINMNIVSPGTRFNVYETDEKGKYSLGDLSIEVEYQILSNGEIKLYNQELLFKDDNSEITVTGFIPSGYSLNCIRENANELESEMYSYEDLQDYQMLCVYDINVEKDGVTYQPEMYDFAPNLSVNITSIDLNTLPGESNVKLIHFAEDELQTIQNFETNSNSIEFAANSFSRYAVISQKSITVNNVTINTLIEDQNYYLGKNYTENKNGENSGKYTTDNLAKVTINYHGNKIDNYSNEESNKVVYSSNQSSGQDNINIEVEEIEQFVENKFHSVKVYFKIKQKDGSQINIGEKWQLEVSTGYTFLPNEGEYTVTGSDNRTLVANGIFSGEDIQFVVIIRGSRLNNGYPDISNVIKSFSLSVERKNQVTLGKNVTGYISADENEKQNLVTYQKMLPIVNNQVQIELIDNPFMDRPVGERIESITGNKIEDVLFGFNGWVGSEESGYTITSNNNTKVQTLNVPINGNEITIDLYADWKPANTVFVKEGGSGNKSGKSIENATDSFSNAISILNEGITEDNANVLSQRELNIIIPVGDLSINARDASNKSTGYTITSLYNGNDYRKDASIKINGNIELSSDLQLAFLNIVESEKYNYIEPELDNSIIGNNFNLRIGRGMTPINCGSNTTTFRQIQGGGTQNNNKEYRTVVESGRYSSIYADKFYTNTSNSKYNITSSLVIGCDYDNNLNNNDNLNIYYRVCSRITPGRATGIAENVLYDVVIKSGTIGIDAFKVDKDKSQFSGIMLGGTEQTVSENTCDIGDRIVTIEGGKISNVVGGVMNYSGYKDSTNTYIYIKGEKVDVQTVIGGAVQLATAGDRIIQITSGKIQYSVCSGSNGKISNSSPEYNGKLDGNTLLYIGGNAVIGGDEVNRIKPISENNKESIYGLQYGTVLGAGNGNISVSTAGVVNSSHVIIDGDATIKNNVYAGGNYGGVEGTANIYMENGTIGGTIYGGSNNRGTVTGNSSIYIAGGTINGNVPDEDAILADGQIKENEAIFAGGYGTGTNINGDATIHISNTNDVNIKGNIYGGSARGYVGGNSIVEIQKSSKENNISIIGNVFGAGKAATNRKDVKVIVDGGSYPNLIVFGGANLSGLIEGNVSVEIGKTQETNLNEVYGGGNLAELQSISKNLELTNNVYLGKFATITNAYNGGNNAGIASNFKSKIDVDGATIKENLYGGSNNNGELKSTNINVSNNANIGNIYGAGYGKETIVTENTTININNSTVQGTIYGGGNNGTTGGSTLITINDNSNIGTVYGGGLGETAVVENSTKIQINDSNIEKVYGGGKAANVNKDTDVILENSTVTDDIYGAGEGSNATVAGSTRVNLKETSTKNVFGGGDLGVVKGSTYVRLTSSTIEGNAYAAGNGSVEDNGNLALVEGSTKIIVEGNSTIGENLFGGGNAANVGKIGISDDDKEYIETANTEVYISGATIGTSNVEGKVVGNVYGGSNRSRIYGNANIYIGKIAVDQNYEKGKIEIKGTVYGGGESVTGGQNFNYDFKSVNGDIYINIDGNEYDTLNENDLININGSIFGSGNASSAAKNGTIVINKYGSKNNIKNGISIQRASEVTISNSVMKLSGTTDSTNVYVDTNYTLNHIGNLKIKDYTSLYLRYGANLLESFSSLSNDDSPAVVEIDNEHNVKAGYVDNRIYMYSGQNFNISKDTEHIENYPGDVIGMTFFGLYVEDSTGSIYSGVYNQDYNIGKDPTWEERQFERTYVLGVHKSSHDITKDGFYTVFEELDDNSQAHKEDGTLSEENYKSISSYLGYINPEPEDQLYYRWYSGFSRKVINIPVDLIASRYSTFATKDVNLSGTEEYPNAKLTLESFNISNDWIDNVGLYDKNDIKKVEADEEIANTHFGLGMKTGNNGWISESSTDFLLEPGSYEKGEYDVKNDFIEGTTYKGDNTYYFENLKSTIPSLGFYLYNSNTINLPHGTKIGTYKLKMQLTCTQGQNFVTVDVIMNISITVSKVEGENIDGYNASITPGIKYDLFTRTPTDITTKSSFSAIFELAQPHFKNSNETDSAIYDEEKYGKLYRIIDTGNYVFPANTTITMIDKSIENDSTSLPKYYYYTVTEKDSNSGKTIYNLEDFIAMGTANPKMKYNESEMNSNYYNSSLDYEYECFIFIVNFENANFASEGLGKITNNPEIKIELRAKEKNSDEDTRILGIIGSQQEEGRMQYNIYSVESEIEPSATINNPTIYIGNTNLLTVNTIFSTAIAEDTKVYNTQYFNRKLGAKITFHKINSDGSLGEQIAYSALDGLFFQINDKEYHPKSDGTTRLKMTDIVANTSTPITINATKTSLTPGKYIILIETFGSADGIYYGKESSLPSCQVEVSVVSNEYGLKSTIKENQVIIDRQTGSTLDSDGYASKDLNDLDVDLEYKYSVANPYITVSLERRKYDTEYSLEYEAKDIKLTDYIELNSEDNKDLIEVTDIWGEFKDYEERPRRSYRTEYEVLSLNEIQAIPETGEEKIRKAELHYKIKPDLPQTGTYRLIFTLYDKTGEEYQYIGEVYSYIIIK